MDTYTYFLNGSVRTPKVQKVGPSGGEDLFTYDLAGNAVLASGPSRELEFRYDPQGRLFGLFEGVEATGASLTLDGRGFLRESRQNASSCTVLTTEATYSSQGVLLQRRQRNALTGGAQSSVSVFYFAGRPVAQLETVPTAAYRYLTTDHLGTPTLALNSTTTVWSGGFEPFGRDWRAGTSQGASENGVFLRFPGHWSDQSWSGAGGLHYNVHRWYQPATGRYTSPDPVRGGVNDFSYVDSRPLVLIDPLGLVASSSECGNCCIADIIRERQQIADFFRRNGHRYRRRWLQWSYGCGDAADTAWSDVEKEVRPKCWISGAQMLAPGRVSMFGVYVVVHFVPIFTPCGGFGAPLDDLHADPYRGNDDLRPLPPTWREDDVYCPRPYPL